MSAQSPQKGSPCVEIATNEGIFEKIAPAKGLLIEHVSLRLPTQQVAWLMKLLFLWRAALETRPTKMLVDTGSAVTILRELVRVEGSSRHSTPGTTSDRRKW